MDELISVIIPVYKVEKYIHRCIDSILKQSFSNLEIILVDDGSLDTCGDICDEYAIMDHRIKVIHQENGGLSDARNTGIESAKGTYLTFLDSDDWVHELYIEKLYNLLKRADADISACNFVRTWDENISVDESANSVYIFSNMEALDQLYEEFYVPMVVAWGKIYKAALFNGIRYPKGKVHEDEFTTYKLFYEAKTIAFSTEQLHYYWQRPDSITGVSFNVKNSLDIAQALYQRGAFFNEKGLFELRDRTYRALFFKFKKIFEYMYNNNVRTHKKEIDIEFKKLRKKLRIGTHSLRFRIFYELYFLLPNMMNKVYTLYKR